MKTTLVITILLLSFTNLCPAIVKLTVVSDQQTAGDSIGLVGNLTLEFTIGLAGPSAPNDTNTAGLAYWNYETKVLPQMFSDVTLSTSPTLYDYSNVLTPDDEILVEQSRLFVMAGNLGPNDIGLEMGGFPLGAAAVDLGLDPTFTLVNGGNTLNSLFLGKSTLPLNAGNPGFVQINNNDGAEFRFNVISATLQPIPEPSTFAMLSFVALLVVMPCCRKLLRRKGSV